jgi:hypothetical protein
MSGYTKLFSSIITSTIWGEDSDTKVVWITLLAMKDRNGEVKSTIPGLARLAGVPRECVDKAIAKFLAPDPDSRTKDFDGRRIQEIDGGWIVHKKYCSEEDEKRAMTAERVARWRERQKKKCVKENV